MAISETEIFEKARRIVGNSEDAAVAERYVPDEAVRDGMIDFLAEITSCAGTNTSTLEKFFQTVAGQQHYSIASVIGANVGEIVSVLRSGANDNSLIDCGASYVIDPGLQDDVFDAIRAQRRAARSDLYEFQDVIWEDVRSLRLIPCPTTEEQVVVKYTLTSTSIATLPDVCRAALVNAAVVSIFDGIINRIHSQMVTRVGQGAQLDGPSGLERVKVVQMQRDRYEVKYQRALMAIKK